MLKGKMKKKLIILLFMVVIVQTVPTSNAGLKKWSQLPFKERDEIQNLLESENTTKKEIDDYIGKYNITYDDLINYFSECDPENYKEQPGYKAITGSEGSSDDGKKAAGAGRNHGTETDDGTKTDDGTETDDGTKTDDGTETDDKNETGDSDNGSGSGESTSNTTGSFSDWQQQAEDFINRGKQNQTITTKDAITSLLPVGRLLVGIATIVLVIVGSIMGVKYMIAGANEKAQLKQKLIYYVISVVLVYGAIGIFTMVVGLMNSILA